MYTSNELPEIRVDIDGAGQVSTQVGDGERRVAIG